VRGLYFLIYRNRELQRREIGSADDRSEIRFCDD